MHILHLIKTSEGAAWALNIIKELKARHLEIRFTVVIPGSGRYIDEYLEFCQTVIFFDFSININFLNNGLRLRKIVKEVNPDIIHSWFTQTTLYARFFLRDIRIPRLFQVVGPLHLESKIFAFFDLKSATNNDYWIATSRYILNKYRSMGVAETSLFLNYAYIDTEKLLDQRKNFSVLDLRKRFSIPAHFKIIGTASYIYPPKFYESEGVKGHEKLLDAFKYILERRRDIVLIIAGSTFGKGVEYEEKLKEKALQISGDRIFFSGSYESIWSVISNFDAFVYLSKSENLGGVFESLLFEVPTISSDRGALPELVRNGETGVSVSLNDTAVIAEEIIKFLESDTSKVVYKGKEEVLRIFDKEKILKTAYEIYKTLLKGSG